ncbi:hypothetical protein ACFXKJ_40910 [Kitasatospora indigofera]|uniref:hypothetical protein n=1 Tax=Kitasatospora indigofera TaxID=67307 RepID=UPI0036865A96
MTDRKPTRTAFICMCQEKQQEVGKHLPKDLYLWKRGYARGYRWAAEPMADQWDGRWFIMSTKYGILHPEGPEIGWYNVPKESSTLTDETILGQLKAFGFENTPVVVLATHWFANRLGEAIGRKNVVHTYDRVLHPDEPDKFDKRHLRIAARISANPSAFEYLVPHV